MSSSSAAGFFFDFPDDFVFDLCAVGSGELFAFFFEGVVSFSVSEVLLCVFDFVEVVECPRGVGLFCAELFFFGFGVGDWSASPESFSLCFDFRKAARFFASSV